MPAVLNTRREFESVGPPAPPGLKYNCTHSSQKQPCFGEYELGNAVAMVMILVGVKMSRFLWQQAGRHSHLRAFLAIVTSIAPPHPTLWPALRSANNLEFSMCNIINIRGAAKWKIMVAHLGNFLIRTFEENTLANIQGFFHWYPPKKLKYGKPRLGESTLT